MKNNFDHFLITRFNLKKSDWKTDLNKVEVLDEVWLKKRVELFKNFCLPSVLNQSSHNFKWLIFFEKGSESDLKNLLEQLHTYNYIEPLFVNGYTEFQALLPSLISERLTKNNEWILTTRLDNDDAINAEFIEKLQQNIQNPKHNTVYHFPQGLCLDMGNKNRLASVVYPLNQFVSLLENNGVDNTIKTVLSREHDKWDNIHTLIKLELNDAWLQVTHTNNLANIFRGVPVYSSRLKKFCISKIEFSWKYDLKLMILGIKRRIRFF